MIDDFTCSYCLEVTQHDEGEAGDYPTLCPGCKTVTCQVCYTRLKGPEPAFCYGCGTIRPEARSDFVRSSSFAAAYAVKGWEDRNRSKGSDGFYSIWVERNGQHVLKRGQTSYANDETVRILTAEEVARLNGDVGIRK